MIGSVMLVVMDEGVGVMRNVDDVSDECVCVGVVSNEHGLGRCGGGSGAVVVVGSACIV